VKPVKLLFTSDWQAAVSNLDRCQLALDQLLRIVDREGVDYVVHLGDLKDAFNPVDQRVSNWLVHAAQEIKKRCQLLVLMGNHDLIAPQDGVPSVLPLLAAAGADVFPEPRLRSLRDRTNLWMVPYIRDPAKQAKAFQEAAADADRHSGTKILCFHCGIEGCRQNVWTKGKGIALKDLRPNRYDLCVGGHIHLPQFSKPNLYYVGSPFCVDWSEVNSDHRFLLVEVP